MFIASFFARDGQVECTFTPQHTCIPRHRDLIEPMRPRIYSRLIERKTPGKSQIRQEDSANQTTRVEPCQTRGTDGSTANAAFPAGGQVKSNSIHLLIGQ